MFSETLATSYSLLSLLHHPLAMVTGVGGGSGPGFWAPRGSRASHMTPETATDAIVVTVVTTMSSMARSVWGGRRAAGPRSYVVTPFFVVW